MAAILTPAIAEPVATESGLVEGVREESILVFKGLPYAAPPVGDLRWRAPAPAPAWEGVRAADAFSPICPQAGAYPPGSPVEPMSEDCLTLNIWAPADAASRKLPVMVWIHGGGLVNGSGSNPLYRGDRLAMKGVVVVTFNYRLGALGFLAHPELNSETERGGSGNYGFLDQIAALRWVKRNIASFGGDPDQVTVFGQSSGSISISALASSPLAKGLFNRAIGQSGGLFEPVEFDPSFSPEGASAIGANFASKAGASSIGELRRAPVDVLLKVRYSPQFNIDGHALTESPYDIYADNEQNDVDLLVGANAEEGKWFLAGTNVTVANFNEVLTRAFPGWLVTLAGAKPGTTDAEALAAAVDFETDMRFRWNMWAWARYAARAHRGHVFFYQFTKAPPFREGDPNFGLGAAHGVEMPYVFGHFDPQSADWTADDARLGSVVADYWTNFAKTGDPNVDGLPHWKEFVESDREVMSIGDNIGAAPIPQLGRLQRIDRIYSAARFLNENMAATLAAALAALLFILTLIVIGVRRLFRRRL